MTKNRLLNAAIIVSALGYFVDVFDLLLFGVVRVKSLAAMGLGGQALIVIAFWASFGLKDTFHQDLDFLEKD
jgi:hypothetical protein